MLFKLLAAASATDAAIKKIIRSGMHPKRITLIIPNEEMDDNMRIVKSIEESGLLRKGISEKTKDKAKEHKNGFLSMLLGTLAASL